MPEKETKIEACIKMIKAKQIRKTPAGWKFISSSGKQSKVRPKARKVIRLAMRELGYRS